MASSNVIALPTPTPAPARPDGEVVAYVRNQFEAMQRFRSSIGYDVRLLDCLRQRLGQYEPSQLAAIREFGGSEVFARLTANKCRGAAAMLREIYIANERPWDIDPSPVPTLPVDPMKAVVEWAKSEGIYRVVTGQGIDDFMFEQQLQQLLDEALRLTREQAKEDAIVATRYIDDILVEGGFYTAMTELIEDFVTYPMAILRGPTAVMQSQLTWVNGKPQMVRKPLLTWQRVDPQDFWWSAGGSRITEVETIQRMPMTRAEINGLLGLPGYNDTAIRAALTAYGQSGLREPAQFGYDPKANLENRGTLLSDQNTIDVLLYCGPMQGHILRMLGLEVADPVLDYLTHVVMCGQYLFKVQIDPNPRQRPPYYVAAYEPVPNSLPGNALPELFGDLQQSCNAALRALVNNLAMASGPQVAIDTAQNDDPMGSVLSLRPWQVWQFRSDPALANSSVKPVDFFQPNMNAGELMGVFNMLSNLADEVSAVPRYLTGNERVGGAGRTASGLSMLMQNSGRVMESIAANIDRSIIEPAVQATYDLVMLSGADTPLRGDEKIRTRGATNARAKEADKMRLLELLSLTNNPVDLQILGAEGRAQLLRRVLLATGTDTEHLVGRDNGADKLLQMLGGQMIMPAGGRGGGSPVGGTPPQGGPDAAGVQPPGPTAAGDTEGMMRNRASGMGPVMPRMAAS